MSVLEGVQDFITGIGNQVSITFKTIDDFIDSVITFFVSGGYWVSVLIFFLLFFGIISIPLWLAKYYETTRKGYGKLMKKLFSSPKKT